MTSFPLSKFPKFLSSSALFVCVFSQGHAAEIVKHNELLVKTSFDIKNVEAKVVEGPINKIPNSAILLSFQGEAPCSADKFLLDLRDEIVDEQLTGRELIDFSGLQTNEIHTSPTCFKTLEVLWEPRPGFGDPGSREGTRAFRAELVYQLSAIDPQNENDSGKLQRTVVATVRYSKIKTDRFNGWASIYSDVKEVELPQKIQK